MFFRRILYVVAIVLLASVSPRSPVYADYVVLSKASQSDAHKQRIESFLRRLLEEAGGYESHPRRRVRHWQTQLLAFDGDESGERDRLRRIYRASNGLVQYRPERVDVWHTPGETIARGFGDCEDFAAIYLAAARMAGIQPARLWLVFGYAYGARGRQGHAVTLVEAVGGEQFVLDNMIGWVIPARKHTHFLPVYGINAATGKAYLQVNTAFKALPSKRRNKALARRKSPPGDLAAAAGETQAPRPSNLKW
jgi:predicted transglutaminase-like cysteine proteinase